jgi:hypothetical protein
VTARLFGMHDGHSSVFSQAPVGAVRLWDVGVTWQTVEPSPGVYDFAALDARVNEATEFGAKVTYVLGMTPAFYGTGHASPPPLDKYDSYVRAVMARYKDKIDSYQVWNETNIANFWTGTQEQVAQLTEIVYRARNEIDSAALLVAPSGPVRKKYQRTAYREYLAAVDKSYIDAYAFSLYPLPDVDNGPEAFYDLINVARSMLAYYGEDSKPLWAAEINYAVGSQTYTGGLTELLPTSEQVSNVMKTYILARAGHLERCFWYRWDMGLWEGTDGTTRTIANTIMTKPGLTITPAGRAFGRVQSWLKGNRFRFSIDSNGTYRVSINDGGKVKKIYWNNVRGVHIDVAPRVRRTTFKGASAIITDGSVWVTDKPVLVTIPSVPGPQLLAR